jgi:hypothetical protein
MGEGRVMNRRERRAAVARGEREVPESYVRTIQRMIDALRAALKLNPGNPPRFALPPRDVILAATVDQVEHIVARDPLARELCQIFCAIGVEISGPGGQPSVTMLAVALDAVGLKAEQAAIEEFGRVVPFSPGSTAGN